MSLLDKLRTLRNLPDDTDLLVALGIEPGTPFGFAGESVRFGDESVSHQEAREAVGPSWSTRGRFEYSPAEPVRTVTIGDLDGA